MTLRARLISITVSVVALVVLALLIRNLNSLMVAGLKSSIALAGIAGSQVTAVLSGRVAEQATELSTPDAGMEETKRLWRKIVAEDDTITDFLEHAMAQESAIIEINVAGEDGIILASSNPKQRRQTMVARQELESLNAASPLSRFLAIYSSRDYEKRFPLGTDNRSPVFTVQVLVSAVLLRDAVKPELFGALWVSLGALGTALVLAYWTANLALRPLARIGRFVDAIVRGDPIEKDAPEVAGMELVAIESKLSLLGEQYRGARQDATQLRSNLDSVLEKLDAETRGHFESQLAISRRLAAINSLTGRVAHEIKNPLNSIALRLELLRSSLGDDVPTARSEINVLSQEVTRLDRVVKTFLDFNRPLELALEDVDIAELCEQVIAFLRPEAAAKGIETFLTGGQGNLIVRGDVDLLKQALMNIAVNAIEAMTGGGELRIDVAENEAVCQVRISDTGPGIPAEQREKIFDLYFTTKPTGTGIGLAMAFRSVQLHGGTIKVESESGKGSTFSIELPLAHAESRRDAKQ